MQIFFDELKPYDKPDETLYIRFTKEDFPGLCEQFKNITGELAVGILNAAHKDVKEPLIFIKAIEELLCS